METCLAPVVTEGVAPSLNLVCTHAAYIEPLPLLKLTVLKCVFGVV